jgi:hypothetical protein
MKQLLIFNVVSLLLVSSISCDRKPHCDVPYSFEDETCELYATREYPNTPIPFDALAYYTAEIEDQYTSFSDRNEGIVFLPGVYSLIRGGDSITTGGGTTATARFFGFDFFMRNYAPFVGKTSGILSFRTSEIPQNISSDSLLIVADKIFSVGDKIVNSDNFNFTGWGIDLHIRHIDHPREPNLGLGSFWLNSTSAFQPSGFNHLAITKLEKEDLGDKIRYHIWFDFQCDLYWSVGWRDVEPDGYWGKVENGKAKFYMDLNK